MVVVVVVVGQLLMLLLLLLLLERRLGLLGTRWQTAVRDGDRPYVVSMPAQGSFWDRFGRQKWAGRGTHFVRATFLVSPSRVPVLLYSLLAVGGGFFVLFRAVIQAWNERLRPVVMVVVVVVVMEARESADFWFVV